MCWQDWKIGAQTRQREIVATDALAVGGNLRLPANNRRMGIVVHGPIDVEVRAARGPTDSVGHIIAKTGIAGAASDPWPNVYIRSTVLSVAEFGNDLRGELFIRYASNAAEQFATVNELEWCGPESLDGGL